ncbi:MAG: hypothetical protein FJY98_00730 [Candidatus Liptonbacteria bacterium]|nr:hypothetical protein [Candidatus Liptonbacteria bacterium]
MRKSFWMQVVVVAATTVGAGMFALPYTVQVAGWLPTIFYLVALGIILAFVHGIYFVLLSRVKERKKLVGLVRDSLGEKSGMAAFVVVMGGQILTLLAYLILGQVFISLLFPALPRGVGVLLFWAISSLPLLLNIKRFARLEAWGIIGMLILIGLLFLGSDVGAGINRVPTADWTQVLLPFGVVLFALAGWTAVEPVYELGGKSSSPRAALGSLSLGTGISVLLYLAFVLAVLGSPASVTPDAVSGFSDPLHRVILAILGLFAIWTSYLPVGREATNAFVDGGTKRPAALLLVLFLPLILFGLGLSDFVKLVGVIGGVFLALQYIFILGVGGKVLRPRGYLHLLFWLLYIILGAGAVYELYYFVAG